MRYVATSQRPIRSPDDLQGPQAPYGENAVVKEAFRTLGVEVVPMPMARPLTDALAQGALDGVDSDIDAIMNWEMFRWASISA